MPATRHLPFSASNVYIPLNSRIGRKASHLRINSIKLDFPEEEGTPMDQVAEQVIETKEEVIELSMAELAQVGGGAVAVIM